jgi:hypothetical protein
MRTAYLIIATVFCLVVHPVAAAEGSTRAVSFPQGKSLMTLKGQIAGRAYVDYVVRGKAGQTLSLSLSSNHLQTYFNLLPPRSELAMRAGENAAYKAMLPAAGDYIVRVYLMRAAGRRNERSDYSLQVGLAGKPLKPIPASRDALIPGTSYHASATIRCVPFLKAAPESCEAFVTRYVGDQAATVEARSATGPLRRILFIKGTPVASDAPDPMSAVREGDLSTVKFGADERYEIPDALITGG